MRNLILSALLLASAFQTALGETFGDFQYSVFNGEVRITSYTGSDTSVTFPASINGMTVRELGFATHQGGPFMPGNNVIQQTSPVTTVIIPDCVKSIGNAAFELCENLTSVTIVATPNPHPSGIIIQIGAFRNCEKLTSVNLGNHVSRIETQAFMNDSSLTTLTIPESVNYIGQGVFMYCENLTSVTMPDRFIGQVAQIGIEGQVATDYLVNALANNDAFVTAVANKIKATGGNYGLSVKSELETLATKTELTSALTESRTAGVNSVLSNPNLWTLYTTSQIQNMAVGDLVLTRQVSGGFVLNYDIEQSTDLQTWTPYQALSLPLTGLPTDKAFVRIKAKQ